MKKLLAILAFSFLILSKVSAGDLKNPGDIMFDFESFSPANCDYQCFENIDENYIWPDFPDTFTDKWLDENLLRQEKKYKKTYSKHFPTELSFYSFYKKKFPDQPNIKKFDDLVFDKRMCNVPAKQRMKYCTSKNQEVTFKEILKSDSKKLKKQNDFMGQRCYYFTGKYKPEIRNNFVVVIKNKIDEKYLFKTKGPSKKIAESIGLKDCKNKHSEGCYVHYSSRIAFGG